MRIELSVRYLALVLCLSIFANTTYSQDEEAVDSNYCWYHDDLNADNVVGISLDEAYSFLKEKKRTSKTVIVAILDSGTDTAHLDLKNNLWVNEDEIPGNGIDDDENGYIDDVNGWNFIGGPDGENVNGDTWEMTRYYAKLKERFNNKTKDDISEDEKEDFELWLEVKEKLEAERAATSGEIQFAEQIIYILESLEKVLAEYLNKEDFTLEDVEDIETGFENVMEAKNTYISLVGSGLSKSEINSWLETSQKTLNIKLNPRYDSRDIVGDDDSDITDTIYGNSDVMAKTSSHGTSVAGIVGAERDNDEGIDGVADNVKLMIVRIVPGGDERDKDVAMGIRYAVNNGAQIINCSFGKDYSPYKKFVDDAVKYAEENNVLIVHACGNDGANIDENNNFPNAVFENGKAANNWLEVGASASIKDETLMASFSNFGKESVDVFAPGVDILTCKAEGGYSASDGTSVASPVVAGVAALLLSYYPQLTATQLRQIIMDSSVKYLDHKVYVRNSKGKRKKKKFGDLSKTGGIVNAFEAVKMAEELVK